MLRVLLISGGFLVVTVALLLLQPSEPPQKFAKRAPITAPEQQVSRAKTNLVEVDAAALNPARPSVMPETDQADLANSTASVLAGLGGATTPSETSSEDDKLRDMTAGVLAGLNALRPTPETPTQALQNLIVRALGEGQSDSYIDALVNEAANAGALQVPNILVTEQGSVDTRTLLASIVGKATGVTPEPAAYTNLGGEGVEVRVVQRAGGTVQYRFYTVQRGDSLGGIAVKFYGDAAHFPRIYEANKQFLSSANKIRVGQRLSIPII